MYEPLFIPSSIITSRNYKAQSLLTSSSHSAAEASLGILQSPRGESVTEPTFTPSGRQLRLNCCEKNLR